MTGRARETLMPASDPVNSSWIAETAWRQRRRGRHVSALCDDCARWPDTLETNSSAKLGDWKITFGCSAREAASP
jgi:hypothetical protein